MKTLQAIPEILKSIESKFSNQAKKIRENISLTAYSIIRCQKLNTAEIARYMGEVNGQNFKANDMRLYRLLQSKNFQVDDKLWRDYFNLLFSLIKENSRSPTSSFRINVDYTSDTDDFLILCASIYFQGQSVPLYFSMRKYPKRSGMLDQKKLELAFFKELRHLLPKGNEYIIVADRGFGNNRIIEILEDLDFKYVLRLNTNLNAEIDKRKTNLKDLPHKNARYPNIKISSWDRSICLIKRVKEGDFWLLATNLTSAKLDKIGLIYEKRFSIEKMFKNEKSGGLDLEKLQIRKYDRFKRLLFISHIAYAIMIFTGLYINDKKHAIKKNYFLSAKVLSAFSA
jgi:hypothetical protein